MIVGGIEPNGCYHHAEQTGFPVHDFSPPYLPFLENEDTPPAIKRSGKITQWHCEICGRTVMITGMEVEIESWPLQKPFVIAHGSRNETETVTVSLCDGDHVGRGEAVASPRYAQTSSMLVKEISKFRNRLMQGLDRQQLQQEMPAGPARNAVDVALWDLEAKRTGRDVGELTGLGWPEQVQTVHTISISSPEDMGAEARRLAGFPTIKIKLDAEDIIDRLAAVHQNAPHAGLLVDANESWTMDIMHRVAPELNRLGVVMVEQPLPAAEDEGLHDFSPPIPIFADESCHRLPDLASLRGKYQGINIKLDKTGGLTEALALDAAAREQGFQIMIGCMLGTSLGVAPAMFLAPGADYVDIDPPALLASDRTHCLQITDGEVSPLSPALWGGTI